LIDNMCYGVGQGNPDNNLQFCNPNISRIAWTGNGAKCVVFVSQLLIIFTTDLLIQEK